MNNSWLTVLMVHLIRCPITIEKAIGKLLPKDVAEVLRDNTMGFIWHCSESHFKEYKRPIQFQFMMARLEEFSRSNGLSDEELFNISDFLEHAYKHTQEDMEPGEALKYLKNLLQTTKLHKPLQELISRGADMDTLNTAMRTGSSAASIGQAAHFDPLASIETIIGATKPEVIGTSKYWNVLLNGGLCPGEIVVLMGPMGGFKTTMAIDVVCGMAEMQQYSAFMAYEQAYSMGDLPARFAARLAHISRDRLATGDYTTLSDEEKAAIAEAQKMSSYIRFMDRCSHMDYVTDISANVQSLVEAGMKPKLVVIDQLLTWIQRWETVTDDNKRQMMANVIIDLKRDVCEKHGVAMVVLHQIAAAEIAKGKSFHFTAAAECKSIGFWADFVLTIGNLEKETKIIKAIAGKTRRGEQHEMLISVDGSTCSFKEAKDYTESKRHSGGIVKVGEENAVPDNKSFKSKTGPVNLLA